MMESDGRAARDSGPRLPFYARWFLRLLLNRRDCRTVMNDVAELYEQRRSAHGDRAARAWLRRQLFSYPYRLAADRFRRVTPRHRRLAMARDHFSRSKEPMDNLLRDFRYSVRSLAKTPVLTATIVLTVGLGLGATTAIFSVINAVLLQPLPYDDPGQLVRIYTDSPPNRWPLSVADYQTLNEQQTSFSMIAGYDNATMTFNDVDVAERVSGRFVTWTYFPLLGISAVRGRLFAESDNQPSAEPTVVVSHGFWTRRLDGNESAIGRTVRLNGDDFTVIGVLPRNVGPLEQGRDFFAAAQWAPPPRKGPFFIAALGRLDGETDVAVAAAELRTINRRLFPIWQASYQDEKASWGMADLKSYVIGDVRTMLAIALAAVVFVLLIACTNAANLLVARATHRSRELAVRSALGASRGRLLQHLLSESTLLALGGALVGLAVTDGGISLLTTVGADFLPRTSEIGLHGPVALFLVGVTVAGGLMFGLIPSLYGTRSRIDEALNSGGRSATDAAGPRRLRRALVISQYAIAAPLLIAAGLLIGSLARLQKVDPGFDTENLLTVRVSLPSAVYSEASDVQAFWGEALSRVGALPGVQGAALADSRPPRETSMWNNFNLVDDPTPPNASEPVVPWVAVTPEYLDVIGIPLIRGRWLEELDRDGELPVVVVDEAWARRFFPNEDAVGRRFVSGGCTSCPLTTVVGVVGDVKYTGLDNPGQGTVYYPALAGSRRSTFLVLRTLGDPMLVLPSVRQAVRDLDSSLPLSNIATMDELIADSLDTPRYLTLLVAAFASVALLLSIVGIYGVMSYFVQRHTKDIAIRIALGGGPSHVWSMVVKQGMALVAIGMVFGVGGALALTRLMSSLLFGVGATDPLTFIAVAAVMLGISLIACVVPARRAGGVDPAIILREE
jgi:putative ABC transport system permease protein